MKLIAAIALPLLFGCQPVYQQEPGGFISMNSSSDRCLLKVDPAYGRPPIHITAKCTLLADNGIRVATDSCGTFQLNPISKRGPKDGLTSMDGDREVSSHADCPLHATPFPDAWTLQ